MSPAPLRGGARLVTVNGDNHYALTEEPRRRVVSQEEIAGVFFLALPPGRRGV